MAVTNSKNDIAQAALLSGALGGAGTYSEEVARLLAESLAEELREKRGKKDAEKAFREQCQFNTQKEMREREERKSRCSHRKPNGVSNLGGQRDHSGMYHFICQSCQSEFDDRTVPPNLRPDSEKLGGPM